MALKDAVKYLEDIQKYIPGSGAGLELVVADRLVAEDKERGVAFEFLAILTYALDQQFQTLFPDEVPLLLRSAVNGTEWSDVAIIEVNSDHLSALPGSKEEESFQIESSPTDADPLSDEQPCEIEYAFLYNDGQIVALAWRFISQGVSETD